MQLDLYLQCHLAGFTLRIPLLGGACGSQLRRRSSGSRSHRTAAACDAAAVQAAQHDASGAPSPRGKPGIVAAVAAAAQPAEVLQLQQLLVGRDPGMLARLEASGERADAHFFTRWLIARRWCMDDAARDIAAHADWRVAFMGTGADGSALEGLQQGGERKVFLQGCDRWGQPVVLVKAGRHVLVRPLLLAAFETRSVGAMPSLMQPCQPGGGAPSACRCSPSRAHLWCYLNGLGTSALVRCTLGWWFMPCLCPLPNASP